jgi:hypothetical protein
MQNARDAIRGHVLEAQNTAARLLHSAEGDGIADAASRLVPECLPETVGEPD